MENIQETLKRIEGYLKAISVESKELMTLPEVAEYLNVSTSHIYKWTSEKTIPHYKPNGKKIYFKRTEINEWVERGAVELTPDFEELSNQILLKMAGRRA